MLRAMLTLAVFVLVTAVFGLPAILITLLRPESDATMRAGRIWSAAMLRVVGARVEYVGLERAREHLPCIFMANHQSSVDIWALVRILPAPARFVAKLSLFRVPVLGWAMSAGGFVSIDRANRASAIRSLQLAAERVRAGRPVVLFPEGTRTRDGRLQPFKKGPFHLALEAGVPIVPVAISGSWDVMPPRRFVVRPGAVKVELLPAVEVTGYLPDDHEGLLREVRRRLAAALGEPPGPPGAEA
jgi:1-acyl-sn-glycerol-3-phosphate acyltransferase